MNIRLFYLPTLGEWGAFFLGMREFRSAFTTAYLDMETDDDTWSRQAEMQHAYDCGREFAHWVTLRYFEQA